VHADVRRTAALAPPPATIVEPDLAGRLDEAYERYRRLVVSLAPLSAQPWA
jgi:hypothetical protein